VIAALKAGRSVIVYTSRGDHAGTIPASLLGTQLGELAASAISLTGIERLVIAGGDTSSYAARALGINALEIAALFSPGAPLCRAHIPDSPLDGLEVILKGGQVGAPNFFSVAAFGSAQPL
jgi:uncharacterized protein YgbK (DUF1537 family)